MSDMEVDKFKIGDLVSRDGTDVQRVIGKNDYNQLEVECIKAPDSGWCKVGDREWNLAGRYVHTRDLIIKGNLTPADRLKAPGLE